MAEQTVFSERAMLEEARAEVGLADHKASMVLAVLGIGLAAILGGLLAGEWEPSHYEAPGEFFWWLGAVLAVASVVSAASAVWPRYSAADVREGVFYWGHVATFRTLEELSIRLEAQPPVESDRTRHQLHKLARIVQRKYNLVRAAMVLAASAGASFFVAAVSG